MAPEIQVKYTPFYKIPPDSTGVTKPADSSSFNNSIIDFKNIQYQPYSLDSDYPKYHNVKTKQNVIDATGLDEEFINKLIEFEGCDLDKYKDAAGIPTIGFGHNIQADCNYNFGDHITQEQAYLLLAKDLLGAKRDIKNCVGDIELNKDQQKALTELFYNVGYKKIKDTKLIEDIKAKDFEKAACEFDFIGVKGNVHHHTCERRIYDTDKFCSGKHTQNTLKALTNLYDEGIKSLDEKYDKSGVLKKGYYIYQKWAFEHSQTPIIEKAKKNIAK